MMPPLPSPLARRDRGLLGAACLLVPVRERDEWLRAWAAELWCLRDSGRAHETSDLFYGIVGDALWLRSDQLRQAVSGTALLCLVTLLCLVGFSALPALCPAGCWSGLRPWLLQQGPRFLAESTLILFVSYATAAAEIEQTSGRGQFWLRARLFHLAKNVFVLLLTFSITADLTYPFRAVMPMTTEIVQTMSFAFLALLGLRWSMQDDVTRCRHCLRCLCAPERVGRPSHNFLEWNGTELLCSRGHGLLSVPEIETSWCQASAWVRLHSS